MPVGLPKAPRTHIIGHDSEPLRSTQSPGNTAVQGKGASHNPSVLGSSPSRATIKVLVIGSFIASGRWPSGSSLPMCRHRRASGIDDLVSEHLVIYEQADGGGWGAYLRDLPGGDGDRGVARGARGTHPGSSYCLRRGLFGSEAAPHRSPTTTLTLLPA